MASRCRWRLHEGDGTGGEGLSVGGLRRIGGVGAMSMMRHRMISLATVVLALSAAPANAQAYRVVEVAPLPGGDEVELDDINNQLQAVGRSASGRAVYWDLDGTRALPTMSPVSGQLAINNLGVIAGARRLTTAFLPAQLFTIENGVATDVTVPAFADGRVEVRRLTDTGILYVDRRGAAFNAAVYQGVAYELVDATDVNAQGTVVGNHVDLSTTPPTRETIVRRPNGEQQVLLRRVFPATGQPTIGDGGHIVQPLGSIGFDTVFHYAGPDGVMRPVPIPLSNEVTASRPNRAGDVLLSLDGIPCLYSGGRLLDLRVLDLSPIRFLRTLKRITDSGAIVVSATTATTPSVTRDFILLPVPPPAPEHLLSSVSGAFVSLAWNSLPGATDYIVEAGNAPGLANLYNAAVGVFPGLYTSAPPGRYYVRVRARNVSGISVPSNEIIVDVR